MEKIPQQVNEENLKKLNNFRASLTNELKEERFDVISSDTLENGTCLIEMAELTKEIEDFVLEHVRKYHIIWEDMGQYININAEFINDVSENHYIRLTII